MSKYKHTYTVFGNKTFKNMNIKFKFRILEAPLMDGKMGTKIWIQ